MHHHCFALGLHSGLLRALIVALAGRGMGRWYCGRPHRLPSGRGSCHRPGARAHPQRTELRLQWVSGLGNWRRLRPLGPQLRRYSSTMRRTPGGSPSVLRPALSPCRCTTMATSGEWHLQPGRGLQLRRREETQRTRRTRFKDEELAPFPRYPKGKAGRKPLARRMSVLGQALRLRPRFRCQTQRAGAKLALRMWQVSQSLRQRPLCRTPR